MCILTWSQSPSSTSTSSLETVAKDHQFLPCVLMSHYLQTVTSPCFSTLFLPWFLYQQRTTDRSAQLGGQAPTQAAERQRIFVQGLNVTETGRRGKLTTIWYTSLDQGLYKDFSLNRPLGWFSLKVLMSVSCGGVSRGRVCSCSCWCSCWWHVTSDTCIFLGSH